MARGRGIAVRDTVLWVEDTGEAQLPPVLCLHSLWLDSTMFDGLVEAAAGQFRMIRPDFRGQGHSAPATTDVVDMDMCAADILALLDAMDLPSVNLVAQSMGGDVGLRLVAGHPERFRALVMAGSSARSEPPEQLEWAGDWLQSVEADGRFTGKNLDLLMEVMFGATTRADPAQAAMLAHWRAKMEAVPAAALWAAIRGVVERESAVALLPKIKTPTLILSGAEDMPRPPEWADEVAAGIKTSVLVRLEGVGHSPTLEAPGKVIPQILDFLREPRV